MWPVLHLSMPSGLDLQYNTNKENKKGFAVVQYHDMLSIHRVLVNRLTVWISHNRLQCLIA